MEKTREQKSLERLTSPEQLDRLLVIIRMPGWIALLCIFVLVVSIFFWSIFGRINMTVSGTGILFKPDAVELIQSRMEGFVSSVRAQQGDEVKEGDVLIVLGSLQMTSERKEIEEKLKSLKQRMAQEKESHLEKYAIELQQHKTIFELQQKRLKELEAEPGHEQALYDLRIEMENQRAAIRQAQENIAHPDAALGGYLGQIQVLTERELVLQEQIDSLTIKALSDGTVMAVEVLPGQAVSSGQNLIWFQQRGEAEENPFVYSFFPIKSEGSIKPGMKVHLEFNSANATLYGKMVGTVIRVIPFTSTARGGILKSIPSEMLKDYLTHQEATIVVEIEPIKDQTASGYQWTTPQGPPYPLSFSAVAQVEVFIEQRRPIDYLIPLQVDR
jgi:HlyD family secretion protein